MTRNQLAAKERGDKEKSPHLFCPQEDCLWRMNKGRYCPLHAPADQSWGGKLFAVYGAGERHLSLIKAGWTCHHVDGEIVWMVKP